MILAQILIAIIVTTIFSTAFIESSGNKADQEKANRTVTEVRAIIKTAQQYHLEYSKWPDQETGCLIAMAVLRSENSNLNITNPFGERYETSCDSNSNSTFWVIVRSTKLYAGYIKNKVLAYHSIGSRLGADGINSTIDLNTNVTLVNVSKPLADSIHEKFLKLGDTTDTDQIYDIGDNSIRQNGRDLLFIAQYTINVTATPEEFVDKPVCSSSQRQRVHLSAGPRFAAAKDETDQNKAIFGWEILIDTTKSTEEKWALSTTIFTEDGRGDPRDGTLVVAQTYCENT